MAVPHQGGALRAAGEEAVVRASGVLDDQPGRVRIAKDIVAIDPLRGEKLMDQRADKQSVSARTDADPFIGNG